MVEILTTNATNGVKLDRFISVKTPYDPDIVAVIKSLSYARWDPAASRWIVLVDEVGKLVVRLNSAGFKVVCKDTNLLSKANQQRWVEEKFDKLRSETGQQKESFCGLKKPLFAFQRADTEMMIIQPRILNANEMGLGKTVESIAAVLGLKAQGKAKRVLVVCPASMKYTWGGDAKEGIIGKIQEFSDETAIVIDGPRKKRARLYELAQNATFTIVNYELLAGETVRDESTGKPKFIPSWDADILSKMPWDVVIMDEITYVKNTRAARTKGLKMILSKVNRVWGLSGTPLMNNLRELHTIVGMIDPNYFPWWGTFEKIYMDPATMKPREDRVSKLHERLKGIMIRRTKKEVLLDLPDKMDGVNVYVALSGIQAEMYRQVLEEARIYLGTQIENGTPVQIIIQNILSQMLRLKQICVSSELIEMAAGVNSGIKHTSSKLDEIKRLLSHELRNEKVVIFTQFEKMTRILERELAEFGGVVKITGALNSKQQAMAAKQFQEDPNIRIMLLTTAGGMGHTLTESKYIIILDQTWNPALIDQVIDRLHRIGQKNVVTPIWIWAQNSIEDKIWETLKAKKRTFNQVVEGVDLRPERSLTLDDVKSWLFGKEVK